MNHLCVVNDITGSSVDIPFNKSWVCVKYQCFIRISLSCALTVYIVLRVCNSRSEGKEKIPRVQNRREGRVVFESRTRTGDKPALKWAGLVLGWVTTTAAVVPILFAIF